MSAALHIVNGDAAIPRVCARSSVRDAAILPWRDMLHDGPLPSGLDLAALSAVRAVFLAGCGYAPFASTLAQFRERPWRAGSVGPSSAPRPRGAGIPRGCASAAADALKSRLVTSTGVSR